MMSCPWCDTSPAPKVSPIKVISCKCGSLFCTDLGWDFLGVDSNIETNHDDLYYRTYDGGRSVVYVVPEESRFDFVESFVKNCLVHSVMLM